MGIKRVVDTAFWTDGKVDEFSPEDKYFMLYLLTNPFCKQLGIYEISVKQAAFQMGYSVDAVNVLLDRFDSKYGMIKFSKETNEVAIINFLRHSVIKGGKPVEDCIRQDMARVKNKRLIDFVFARLSNYPELNITVKQIVDEYMNENDIHNDNDNDRSGDESSDDSSANRKKGRKKAPNIDKYKELYAEIIAYLNEKTGKNYRSSGKQVQELIHARLEDNYTVDDFKKVIDIKCAEWLGGEYEKYLRPSTLFQASKFDGYLNQRGVGKNGRFENTASTVGSSVGTWL